MRFLVTGATGFIGNYVVKELLSRGMEVVVTGRDKKKLNEKFGERVTVVPFTIGSEPETGYKDFFACPDKVIHLAWDGLPNYKNLFHFENELPIQYNFVKELVQSGLTDITITGTCFEYGMQEGELDEDLPTLPANPYAFSKDCLRKELEFTREQIAFDLKWVRLFYMYGEGQNPKSFLSQLQKAIDDKQESFYMSQGDQLRDYLPVEQIAKNLVDIALLKGVSDVINNCSGAPISIAQLAERYLTSTNQKINLVKGYYPYPDYEPFAFWGSTKKLKKYLNGSN